MKVRTDFVTNSSSSSFILARTSALNEKQKEEILKYVENTFLGTPILTPDSTEEEIQKVFEDDWEFEGYEERQMAVREALKQGKTIYRGSVDFEVCEYECASILEDIWEILEKNGDGNFEAIDGDLSY